MTKLDPFAAVPAQMKAWLDASRSGDMKALGAMLADDVSVYADGGGKRPAALRPLHGLEDVMKLHGALARIYARHVSGLVHIGFINVLPGFVSREVDGELQTTALEIDNGKIVAVYIVRNPQKLRHLH